jgi:hypothetical protein
VTAEERKRRFAPEGTVYNLKPCNRALFMANLSGTSCAPIVTVFSQTSPISDIRGRAVLMMD